MSMKRLARAVIVSAVVDYLTGGGYSATTLGISRKQGVGFGIPNPCYKPMENMFTMERKKIKIKKIA